MPLSFLLSTTSNTKAEESFESNPIRCPTRVRASVLPGSKKEPSNTSSFPTTARHDACRSGPYWWYTFSSDSCNSGWLSLHILFCSAVLTKQMNCCNSIIWMSWIVQCLAHESPEPSQLVKIIIKIRCIHVGSGIWGIAHFLNHNQWLERPIGIQ